MSLEGFDKCTRGFPELAAWGVLAEPSQSLDDLLHVLKVRIQIRFTDDTGERELEHLPQFADMTQYLGVLKTLRDLGWRRFASEGKVRLEQRRVRQQCFAASGPEVVQQRQQYQREIVFAATQML